MAKKRRLGSNRGLDALLGNLTVGNLKVGAKAKPLSEQPTKAEAPAPQVESVQSAPKVEQELMVAPVQELASEPAQAAKIEVQEKTQGNDGQCESAEEVLSEDLGEQAPDEVASEADSQDEPEQEAAAACDDEPDESVVAPVLSDFEKQEIEQFWRSGLSL